MADTYEKDLGQKSSLTVNDFLRVVGSDNVSYKQAISEFMGTIGVDKMVNGATNPSVSSFAELKESAFYTIGNAPNYSDAPATGYGLLCVFNGGTYRTQTYYAFHRGDTYYRISTNSGLTWNAWTREPTRAEIDALTTSTAVTVTAADQVVIDTNKSYKMGRLLFLNVKGHATADISNATIFTISGVNINPNSFTFGIPLSNSAWTINDIGYGYVNAGSITARISNGQYFHISQVFLIQ